MPNWARDCVEEMRRLNPDHDVIIHDAESIPHDLASVCVEAAPHFLSDAIRFAVLREYGGWYLDLDTWPLRPLADAERAYALDGSQFALSRMGEVGRMELAATPLCCGQGHTIASEMIEAIKSTPRVEYSSWGPILLTDVLKNRTDCVRMNAADWLPCHKRVAVDVALRIRRRGNGAARFIASGAAPETVPYAIHLFANDNSKIAWDADARNPSDKPVAWLMYFETRLPQVVHFFGAAKEGLESAGFRVARVSPTKKIADLPDLLVTWNGLRYGTNTINNCRQSGIPVLFAELGFFDRNRHWQLDHMGFCHRASWATSDRIANMATTERAFKKLNRLAPKRDLVRCRPDGVPLILGQVPNDTQLDDSEIKSPLELDKLIHRSGLHSAHFRPHPKDHKYMERKNRGKTFAQLSPKVTLSEALAESKYCITINSNSIVEALCAGVPIMAYGPSAAIEAGAVYPATIATTRDAIDAMENGWCPDQKNVDDYLCALAANQYGMDEIKRGDFWRSRLKNGEYASRWADVAKRSAP